jgi:hypothetical protein
MSIISPKFAADARRLDEEAAARKRARKLRKEYKRVRRHLLELAVWDDPRNPMGITLNGYRATPPDEFDAELQKRAHAVAVAFDRYTECAMAFDPDIPKL